MQVPGDDGIRYPYLPDAIEPLSDRPTRPLRAMLKASGPRPKNA